MNKIAKKIIYILIYILLNSNVYADENYWPIESKNKSITHGNWIMVIPALRNENGNLEIWKRNDWSKVWRNPTTINKIRFVTLYGDDEDRRNIDAKSIDEMIIEKLNIVMKKYDVSSIALIVKNKNEIDIALWTQNSPATWTNIEFSNNLYKDKLKSLEAIQSLFKEKDFIRNENKILYKIIAWRLNEEDDIEYKVKIIGEKENRENLYEKIKKENINIVDIKEYEKYDEIVLKGDNLEKKLENLINYN